MDYYTADLHFKDRAILNYYVNRPFSSCEELEDAFKNNWLNLKITEEDRIHVLGDIGTSDIWEQLPGTKILVKGNHDVHTWYHYVHHGFTEAYDYPIIKDSFLILSHEPMFVNENMPYANIFGHVHDNPMYKTFSQRSACVCACRHNFQLIKEPSIIDEMQKRRLIYE